MGGKPLVVRALIHCTTAFSKSSHVSKTSATVAWLIHSIRPLCPLSSALLLFQKPRLALPIKHLRRRLLSAAFLDARADCRFGADTGCIWTASEALGIGKKLAEGGGGGNGDGDGAVVWLGEAGIDKLLMGEVLEFKAEAGAGD